MSAGVAVVIDAGAMCLANRLSESLRRLTVFGEWARDCWYVVNASTSWRSVSVIAVIGAE